MSSIEDNHIDAITRIPSQERSTFLVVLTKNSIILRAWKSGNDLVFMSEGCVCPEDLVVDENGQVVLFEIPIDAEI